MAADRILRPGVGTGEAETLAAAERILSPPVVGVGGAGPVVCGVGGSADVGVLAAERILSPPDVEAAAAVAGWRGGAIAVDAAERMLSPFEVLGLSTVDSGVARERILRPEDGGTASG